MCEKRSYVLYSDRGISEFPVFLEFQHNEVAASSDFSFDFHGREALLHVF